MSRLPDRGGAVLITGASTGIGKACALHLDGLGYQVFAGVRRAVDQERLLSNASPRLEPIFLDVIQEQSILAAVERLTEEVGDSGLVGLVNNAGIAVAAPLEFIPIDDLRRQIEVNAIGQITVTQAFLPLVRSGKGRVIFISSISGLTATPFLGPYAASKFAMEALADSLRRELLPWGIKVSIVQPGRIETPIWEKSLAAADDMLENLPPKAWEYYGAMMTKIKEGVSKRQGQGTPVDVVAQTVYNALTSPRPKTRYLVGWDAKAVALVVKLVPDWVLDKLIAYQRGIKRVEG
jgi:NAD(P)-dependent dehydrogenase (short-subunit alcohol dehydrogenase family)